MGARTNSIHVTNSASTIHAGPVNLPVTRPLASMYKLSSMVALILAVVSAVGLLYRGDIYPAKEQILSFVPGDMFNLSVGLPALLGTMWLARRGKMIGLLCWPGALFYVLYVYVPYVVAAPLSFLTLPYLALVALSAYAVIFILASMDHLSIRHRLKGFVPARASATILISLASLIVVRQATLIFTRIINPAPVEIIELLTWIADFTVAVPAMLLVGTWLWRDKALGYASGAGMLLGYGLLALSLLPFFVWQASSTGSPLDVGGVVVVLIMAGFCFVPLACFVRAAMPVRPTLSNSNATRIIATTIGVFFGLFSGVNHGVFETLQGNKPTGGVLIHAIGEAQRFWPLGTEDAFTILPNFLVTGIASITVGLAIVIWSLWFLPTRHGRTVFLGLFVLSFLVGGGIGQVAFFLPAWAFATRMDKPLTWWRKVLPRTSWPFLSRLWIVLLALATIAMSIGLEMAIFGYFPGLEDPVGIQDTAMLFVLAAAILYVSSFIAGFGHELQRMERKEQIV